MCEQCGCEHDELDENLIDLNQSIHEINNELAHQIEHVLQSNKILCINIMGSPGSGKTTLIENLTHQIPAKDIAVIQGDLESNIDKKRLEKKNISCHQINTHSGCHLNALMINKAIINLNLTNKKFLIIENIGNLVCPAGIKIGQHINLVVSSTTEGSDKPKKYPYIFHDANSIVISKIDLKEAVDFNEKQYLIDLKNISPNAKVFKTSSKDHNSFKEIAQQLLHEQKHILNQNHQH